MRRVMLAAVAAAVLCVGVAKADAQIPGYPNGCPTCVVGGWLDDPPMGVVSMVSARAGIWVIGGWGMRCFDGAPIDRVQVFYQTDAGYDREVPAYIVGYGRRPDVYAVFASYCGLSHDWLGFGIGVDAASAHIPPGVRRVKINIWKGIYFQQHVRTVAFF